VATVGAEGSYGHDPAVLALGAAGDLTSPRPDL
jgi:hypothetical protein